MIKKEHSILIRLKKYFDTREHDLNIFRFYAAVVIFFLPIFGLVLSHVKPDAIEYFSHRCILAGYWLIILILSFKVEVVKKYMTFFAYLGIYLYIYWIIWICKVNLFSPEYSIGFFLGFCCAAIIFKDWISLGVFLLITIPVTAITVYTTPEVTFDTRILFLSLMAIGFVYFIIISAKSYINQQFELLNQTLEAKVTERTRITEMKTRELELKNLELERFAAVASHDLKSPLRTISSFVSLINRKTKKYEDESIQEYNAFIQDGVKRLTQTVDDLLDFSRMGTSGMKLKEVDLNQLIKVVLKGIGSSINQPDVKLTLPEQFPTKIVCSCGQIEQLFQNLVENAIKFNRTARKEITISFEEQTDCWIFHVADNGIGIPQENLQQIFEMFKRLHSVEEFPGTGIGLGTCKKIVENHQGQISVASELSMGTTFTFSISKNLQATEKTNAQSEILEIA